MSSVNTTTLKSSKDTHRFLSDPVIRFAKAVTNALHKGVREEKRDRKTEKQTKPGAVSMVSSQPSTRNVYCSVANFQNCFYEI